MKDGAHQLLEARTSRDAARAAFDTRLLQVKADLAARSIGGRIADKVADDAWTALDEAVEVAKESKGIVAGTATVLALWFLRQPIISRVMEMFDSEAADEQESSDA